MRPEMLYASATLTRLLTRRGAAQSRVMDSSVVSLMLRGLTEVLFRRQLHVTFQALMMDQQQLY
jgi:hypothetical protein